MKVKAAIPSILCAVLLCGCALRGKPKPAPAAPAPTTAASSAPAPKAEPLSAPQTQVTLPPVQPLDPDALATAPPEQRPGQPTVQRQVRRTPPAPQAKSEAAPVVPPPPVAAPPAEQPPDREPIETLVPAELQRQLQAGAQAKRREARQALGQIQIRTRREADLKRRIEFFLNQSDQAEQRGNMTDADAHARTALGLVRELQGGR